MHACLLLAAKRNREISVIAMTFVTQRTYSVDILFSNLVWSSEPHTAELYVLVVLLIIRQRNTRPHRQRQAMCGQISLDDQQSATTKCRLSTRLARLGTKSHVAGPGNAPRWDLKSRLARKQQQVINILRTARLETGLGHHPLISGGALKPTTL